MSVMGVMGVMSGVAVKPAILPDEKRETQRPVASGNVAQESESAGCKHFKVPSPSLGLQIFAAWQA
jgi:hypothetical protein